MSKQDRMFWNGLEGSRNLSMLKEVLGCSGIEPSWIENNLKKIKLFILFL